MVCYLPLMKAYPVELRERIVRFVEKGGGKVEAAAYFQVGRQTVYRYLQASQSGNLAPKPQPGRNKSFDDERLKHEVKTRPSATLKEHGKVLGVSPTAVWKRLRRLSITLKKNA